MTIAAIYPFNGGQLDPNALGRRHGNRGRWIDGTTPQTGWDCMETLVDHPMICQMCEFQHIKNAYQMEHPAFPTPLLCGCECAGWMTNPDIAERMEKDMSRKLRRRTRCNTLIEDCARELARCTDKGFVDGEIEALATIYQDLTGATPDFHVLRGEIQRILANIVAVNRPMPSPAWRLSGAGNYTRRWDADTSATVFQDRRSHRWKLVVNVGGKTLWTRQQAATPDWLTNEADRMMAQGYSSTGTPPANHRPAMVRL